MVNAPITLLLEKPASREVQKGYPWVFRSQIAASAAFETAQPGDLALFSDPRGQPVALGYINPKPELSGRILSLNPKEKINAAFFAHRIKQALEKREKWFGIPYYRLVHSDGDNLSGLVIDRFGEHIVCQVSTAGMEQLKPFLLEALVEIIKPASITIDASMGTRKLEGLPLYTCAEYGIPPDRVEVIEHGRNYIADLMSGQKTGWFFDQRANRDYVKTISAGKRVIDFYSHSGGFGIASAMGGATHVEMVDRSALALELAKWSSEHNAIPATTDCAFTQADIFDFLDQETRDPFELVIADPPAFIKKRAHIGQGLAAYKKLAFKSASLVAEGGMLCMASCSHHASPKHFRKVVEEGIEKTGRNFTLLHQAGADRDHPVHPLLPESRYLKFLCYQLDFRHRT